MTLLSKRFYFTAMILLSISMITTVEAQWWNPKSWFSSRRVKRVDFLIVTTNHIKSKLLADLIQYETGQPILLLPTGSEKDKMYFLLPTHESDEVSEKDFVRFIDFLQPKNVLFLGDEKYAPNHYIDSIKDVAGTWLIPGSNWEVIAFSAGDMLRLRNLGLDFLVLLNQLDSNGQIKPPASTETYGGFLTKDKFWKSEQNE